MAPVCPTVPGNISTEFKAIFVFAANSKSQLVDSALPDPTPAGVAGPTFVALPILSEAQ
jgi:hypothetical protein